MAHTAAAHYEGSVGGKAGGSLVALDFIKLTQHESALILRQQHHLLLGSELHSYSRPHGPLHEFEYLEYDARV